MTIAQRYVGVKGDECLCGRRESIRHCIACGSSRIYARANRQHTLASGEKKFVETQFRCQSCGCLFIEEEREFCDAPPISQPLAQQKALAVIEAVKQGEHLNSADTKLAEALTELLPKSSVAALSETELKNAWFALKRGWADAKFEALNKKQKFEQSLLFFIEENIKGFNLSQENVEQIIAWQKKEDEERGRQAS
jgi:hypothetical protein